jgi:hypothetical protein
VYDLQSNQYLLYLVGACTADVTSDTCTQPNAAIV